MDKERKKAFSEDLELIKLKAKSTAFNYYHNNVGASHVLITLLAFLRDKKDDPRYKETYDKLKDIFTEFETSGKAFLDEFLKMYPRGLEPGENERFEMRWHAETETVFNNLKRNAHAEKREMQIEDLVREMFADKSYSTYPIFELLLGGSSQKASALFDKVVKTFKQEVRKEIKEFEKYKELRVLNKYVKEKNPIIIGGNNTVRQIELGLSGKSIKNVILVGPAGTGKTVLTYEFVKRIIDENVIPELRGKIVVELNIAMLVAGTRYRGDFEEKLVNTINVLIQNPDAILFIDEAHQMVKLGDAEGASSAGNILKPYITRGELQMIWATTDTEYAKYIDKDKALARRFHKVLVSEPSKEETRQILLGLLPSLEEFFKKKGSPELVDKVLEISEKYTLDQANPAKAINTLELAFANSKVFNTEGEIVFNQDIMDSIKIKYDINISENKTEDTAKELRQFILGQEEPLNKIIDNIRFVEKGLVDAQKPLISMIFAGPTGVGKTETAKIIAKRFCGSEKNLIKVNMGEYGTEMDVTKITGSAPGYIGHDDESGLVAMIKQYPNSVVLFDEIEKAHPKVFDTLLNILEEGEMTDNHKNRVSFRNAIVIFTTNLGYEKDFAKARGIGFVKTKTEGNDIKDAVEKHFRPEFVNRIDEIIVFNGLTKDIASQLIERYKGDYLSNMETKEDLVFTQEDIDNIVKVAEIETYGARGLKRAVRKQILVALDRMEKELSEKKTKASAKKTNKKKEVKA
jgi:ATP-dependent Clp protease ATP-binding subunit ClpA